MTTPSNDDLARLAQWDTPTICNALEVVVPERRATGFTTEHLHCLDPALPPVVGYARTARYRSMTPSERSGAALREHRAAYYGYVGDASGPTIAVIEDVDPVPGFGAFWGEVNTAVHKALGCLGGVTNGSMRDRDDCAPGFQLLAGKIGPSHAHGHVMEFGVNVMIHGMAVKHGDIIHADRHGAVVIPEHAVAELPAAVDLLVRREAVILVVARADDFDIEKLERAMAESAEIH
jgi:regulator of RNase E activity RraA